MVISDYWHKIRDMLEKADFWKKYWRSVMSISFFSMFLTTSLCTFWLIVAWYGVVTKFVCFFIWFSL